MTHDPFRQQTYSYFLMEAQDLLQAIEQDLLSLRSDRQPAKVHNLMRAAHTLKGAAASVGFQSMKTMAHNLEDVFKALYNPEVAIDAELETLLLVSYDCLRVPITAALAGTDCQDADVMRRANAAFERLKVKLGKYFDPNAAILSSAELGFDITQSIFETGVSERLQELATVLAGRDAATIAQTLQAQAEVFVGLAESLNLPGFGAIAKAAQAALAVNPTQTIAIAEAALGDFRQGQAAVLTGDRTQGGKPSLALKQLAKPIKAGGQPKLPSLPLMSAVTAPSNGTKPNAKSPTVVIQAAPPASGSANLAPTQSSPTRSVSQQPTILDQSQLGKIWKWVVEWLNKPLWSPDQPMSPNSPQLQTDVSIVNSAMASQVANENLVDFNERSSEIPASIRLDDEDKSALADLAGLANLVNIGSDELPIQTTESDQSFLDSWSDWEDQNALSPRVNELEITTAAVSSLPSRQDVFEAADIWQDELLPIPSVKGTQVTQPKSVKGESSSHPIVNQPKPAKLAQNLTHQVQPLVNQAPASSTKLRVDLAHLEALNYSISELLINQNQQALQDEQLQRLIKELTHRLKQHQHTMMHLRDWADRLLISEGKVVRSNGKLAANPEFDGLELDRHSEMHGLLQDALEEMVKLEHSAEGLDLAVRQSGQTLRKQGRLLTNARDDLMEVRMVPIGTILNRLPRVLQQLVESYGKQIELQLKGTQVLVDKIIADKLYDPLLHLIRNAFDHGIESPESRIKHGKSAIGKIEIYAYQQGNRTLIDVRDDGRGLDFSMICRRAYETGLLGSDQVEQFTQADLMNVLFEPGFSTAAQVSDLSGRGVGLDVVKSQVQTLKGIVTVQSTPTQGTTFSLQLPLTLMTARLVVCQVGKTLYGFLSDEVERVLLPQPQQIDTTTGQTVFHWHQDGEKYPVPVHQFSDLISYGTTVSTASRPELTPPMLTADTQPLLLLRVTDGLAGIRVDRVIGEQELVIRPISTAITAPSYIYGCSILGDGCLMLVLDGSALIQQAHLQVKGKGAAVMPQLSSEASLEVPTRQLTKEIATEIPPGKPPVSSPSAKQVLVVDDSITIRQSVLMTLQSAGYEVLQAQDGLDAIEQLKHHPHIQLIICDVEMPRLNGFEFLTQYRQSTDLSQVPVVMLTSRTSEKHRQLALELGATAYMAKPYVNQEFVSTIAQFISAK